MNPFRCSGISNAALISWIKSDKNGSVTSLMNLSFEKVMELERVQCSCSVFDATPKNVSSFSKFESGRHGSSRINSRASIKESTWKVKEIEMHVLKKNLQSITSERKQRATGSGCFGVFLEWQVPFFVHR